MEAQVEITIDYVELMTLAAALDSLIEKNKGLSANFQSANLPDLAKPQSEIAEQILEKLREEKEWLEKVKGIRNPNG